MSGSGIWINAMWILLFVIFGMAFSSYSEDQCSWRGRQVFHLNVIPHVAERKDGHKLPLREATGGVYLVKDNVCLNMLRLATRAQLKCLWSSATIAPAGCLQEARGSRQTGD